MNDSHAPSTHIIDAEGVSKRFGTFVALDGVSLRVPAGCLFGLVGHNGAGKSTLFKLMLGIETASAGVIRIHDQPTHGAGFRQLRQRIGYLPENVALYDNLSGRDTMLFFARLKSTSTSQCDDLLEQVGLARAAHRPVREYSKGMRQRLGFAQALLGTPALLFLDEPTNGLDPQAIHAFYDTLARLKQGGTTIVISSHLLAEIQPHLDAVAFLSNGRLIAEGSPDRLAADSGLPGRACLHLTDLHACALVLEHLAAAGFHARLLAECSLAADVPLERSGEFVARLAPWREHLRGMEMQRPTLEDLYLHHHAQGAPA